MQVAIYIFGGLLILGLSVLLVWNVYGLIKAIINKRKVRKQADEDNDNKQSKRKE